MSLDMLKKVKDFTQEELLLTLEYLESFPDYFKAPFKAIFKRDLDSIAGNGKRVVDKRASILPYMREDPKNSLQGRINVEVTDYPEDSIYQKGYCRIVKDITDDKTLSEKSKNMLLKIVNSPSMNLEDFVRFERMAHEIASVAKPLESLTISKYYIRTILPYKAAAYDFIFQLVRKYNMLSIEDKSLFGSLVKSIDIVIDKKESIGYKKYRILAALVTIYNLMIGSDSFNKEYLMKGYDIHVRNLLNAEQEDPTDFILYMDNFIKDGYSYKELFRIVKEDAKINLVEMESPSNPIVSDRFKSDGRFIFTSEDIDFFFNKKEEIENTMMDDKLYEYLDNVDKDAMIFALSDNDYGHLRNIDDTAAVLNVFGPVSKEVTESSTCLGVRTFLSLAGSIFIIFHVEFDDKILYGISVTEDEEQNRKVLRILLNPTVAYEFID